MSIIDNYLQYLYEATISVPSVNSPSPKKDPEEQEKSNRLKKLQKQLRDGKANCKELDGQLKLNCLKALKPTSDNIKRLQQDLKNSSTQSPIRQVAKSEEKYQKSSTQAAASRDVATSITNAVQTYNTYASRAAANCVNNKDRTTCINRYKSDALQRAKNELVKGRARCSDTINPQKCMDKLDSQMAKYDSKIANLSR